MGSIMDQIFEHLDKSEFEIANQIIKDNLIKRDQNFIEDFVPSLNIISDSAVEVVKENMSHLLGILNFDDDVIRYSMIISLKRFVEVHIDLITPYIEDFLKFGSPKSREGMLILISYVAESQTEAITPFIDLILSLLADKEDFVRKKAVEVLKMIGKVKRSDMEAKILEFLKEQQDETVKNASEEILKEIVEISTLDKEEIEKRQLEAQSKALEEKLHEEEQKLRLEKLKLEEEHNQFEQQRIQQEKERMSKEREILEKQKELEQVKQELERKRIEEERAKIIAEEAERIQKKMDALDKEESQEEDYEEFD